MATEDNLDVSADVEITSNLDVDTIGEYTIKYIYKDIELIRNISVIDTQPPKITLYGNSIVYIAMGQEYNEPGFLAEDNYDGDITTKVRIDSEVDTSTEGEYVVNYLVSDSNENSTSYTRQVIVKTSPLTQSLEEFH